VRLHILHRLCDWQWGEDPLCVDLSPDYTTNLVASAGAAATSSSPMRHQFIDKFNALKREVANSGMKHVLPVMCIAANYTDSNASNSSSSNSLLTGYTVDPESLSCMDAVVLNILVSCARRSVDSVVSSLQSLDTAAASGVVVDQSNVLASCDVVFMFRKSVCCDAGSAAAGRDSQTQTQTCAQTDVVPLQAVAEGPSCARVKVFANMAKNVSKPSNLLIQ
jgi:hypothetical protein